MDVFAYPVYCDRRGIPVKLEACVNRAEHTSNLAVKIVHRSNCGNGNQTDDKSILDKILPVVPSHQVMQLEADSPN
jgi:hypothetical protein